MRKPKNVTLPIDLIQATELFLALQKNKKGAVARDFSSAVEQGLKLLFSYHKTSKPKLLALAK